MSKTNKRNSEAITPPNNEPKRPVGMQPAQQVPTISNVSNQSQSPYGFQHMNSPISPMSSIYQYPVYQQQPFMPGFASAPPMAPNTVGHSAASQLIDNAHTTDVNPILNRIMDRLDKIDEKLDQLDKITSTLAKHSERLSLVENKCEDLEKSQSFIDSKYEIITQSAETNKADVNQLKSEVSKIKSENNNLRQMNERLSEDLIDLKCRSMRDNLLFFGISEEIGNKGGIDMSTTGPVSISGDSHDKGYENRADQPRNDRENCTSKVLQFCQSVLHMNDAESVLKIDRSHRIGSAEQNRTLLT